MKEADEDDDNNDTEEPIGFTTTGEDSHHVCRLKKSLYGLKQALRMWYEKFDSYIRKLGYRRSDSNPCMYIW